MLRQIRLLVGVNIFWLALSMLFDGVNTLVLPVHLSQRVEEGLQATALGLLTFVGLMAGALIQPIAGVLSDRWQPVWGRKGSIGIGLILSLISLCFFAATRSLLAVMLSYLAIQLSVSFAQAGQQGLIPDVVDDKHRGIASGIKGFMDITGAMLGFILLGQLLGADSFLPAIGAMAVILLSTYFIAVVLTPEDTPAKRVASKAHTLPLYQAFRLDLHQHTAFTQLLIARFFFLLGIYATGRFLLLFVADRLNLPPDQAAEQAGTLLAGLALITILASPIAGWLADRIGRSPLMATGAALGALGAILLIWANSPVQILLFGACMSLGSAAFAGGSWALLADLVPKDQSARFFGLANFSTAGAAAFAGLFGPMIDWVENLFPGQGFSILFVIASLVFVISAIPVRDMLRKEVRNGREKNRDKRKDGADAARLAVLSLPADPATVEKDQNPSRRAT